jgi:hypothetical protein
MAIAFAIHCGTEGDSLFNDGPCQTAALKNECGKPCQDDSQCGLGTFCGPDLKCTAECAPNTTCANGNQCSGRGRCNDIFEGGGPIFGGDTGPQPEQDADLGGDACADIDVTLAKVIPTVLLLIDQSSSMTDFQFPPGSGVTRWDALKQALLDPDGGIIKRLENDVSFGVSLYSWNGQAATACPQLTNIAWKLANYNDINTVYGPAPSINNTPTAQSIMGVIGFNDAGVLRDGGFAAAVTPGPKILVLATDGDPDTCEAPNSNGTQPPRNFTLWATQRTFDAGIPTYVVSVGADIDAVHQQQVANAGQGMPADGGDAAVYRPTNREQLVAALNQVILGVRSCKFTLNGAVKAGTEAQGKVTLNGGQLGYNDPNGWKLNSPTDLELVGGACNTILTSPNAQLSVRFPCGTVNPNIPK